MNTVEDAKTYCNLKNLTLLSTEYKGVHYKLDIKCNGCGRLLKMSFNALRQTKIGCKNCAKASKERDRIKRKICKERGVKLLIIPYWITNEELSSYIEKFKNGDLSEYDY